MSPAAQRSIVVPGASAEEAAAIIAALERWLRDTTPAPRPAGRSRWLEAALHEGVVRGPEPLPPWI